ncbi:hypothetical protein TZ02_17885 [Clostridium aceticum]|nr:hypothetical protein TZ02_17885 [Clostridium aceticum]
MEKLLDRKKVKKKVIQPQPIAEVEEVLEEVSVDDTELVAVITAAVAASLNTPTDNIIVKNITRIPDTTPVWGKLGRMQQVKEYNRR